MRTPSLRSRRVPRFHTWCPHFASAVHVRFSLAVCHPLCVLQMCAPVLREALDASDDKCRSQHKMRGLVDGPV